MNREATEAILLRLEQEEVGTRRAGADEIFLPDDIALTAKVLPDTPDRALAVTVYDRSENPDPNLPDLVLAVQVRARGRVTDPLECDDLAEDARLALHQVHRVTWGDLRIERIYWFSGGHIGPDESGRQERSDNYRMVLQRPGPA